MTSPTKGHGYAPSSSRMATSSRRTVNPSSQDSASFLGHPERF